MLRFANLSNIELTSLSKVSASLLTVLSRKRFAKVRVVLAW
jgi:hypothetical protein